MSNVLTGIIGVILFIGLALAGALLLGPRFQEYKLRGGAAAITAATSQMAQAYELFALGGGRKPLNVVELVSNGYLKSAAKAMSVEAKGFPSGPPEFGSQQYLGVNYGEEIERKERILSIEFADRVLVVMILDKV